MFSRVPVYLWYVFSIIYCTLAVYVAPILINDADQSKIELVVVGTFIAFSFGMSFVGGNLGKFLIITLALLITHILFQDAPLLPASLVGIHAVISGVLGGGMLFAYQGGVIAAMRGEAFQVKDVHASGTGYASLNQKSQSITIAIALIIGALVLDIVLSMAWFRFFIDEPIVINDKYYDIIVASPVLHTIFVFVPQIIIFLLLMLIAKRVQKINEKLSVTVTVSYLFISWVIFSVFDTGTSSYVSDSYEMLYESRASYYVNITYALLLGLGFILNRFNRTMADQEVGDKLQGSEKNRSETEGSPQINT